MHKEIGGMLTTQTNFRCNRCNECCRNRGDLRLTPADVVVICQFLHISVKEMMEKYARIDVDAYGIKQPFIKSKNDFMKTCIFLDEGKEGCLIHPVKPVQCYTFPFIEIKEGLFIIQEVACAKTDKEKRAIKDVITETSSRYVKEKRITEKTICVYEELRKKMSKNPSAKKLDMANRIYQLMYLELELKKREDLVEYIEKVLDKVEEILIFM